MARPFAGAQLIARTPPRKSGSSRQSQQTCAAHCDHWRRRRPTAPVTNLAPPTVTRIINFGQGKRDRIAMNAPSLDENMRRKPIRRGPRATTVPYAPHTGARVLYTTPRMGRGVGPAPFSLLTLRASQIIYCIIDGTRSGRGSSIHLHSHYTHADQQSHPPVSPVPLYKLTV